MTDGKHKLIRYYALQGKKLDDWELFDLDKDPNELQSVYGSSDYKQVQAKLAKQLVDAQKQFGVPEDTDIAPKPRNRKRPAAKPAAKSAAK